MKMNVKQLFDIVRGGPTDKKNYTLSLSQAVYEKFQKICEDEDVKASPMVNQLLMWFLENYKDDSDRKN